MAWLISAPVIQSMPMSWRQSAKVACRCRDLVAPAPGEQFTNGADLVRVTGAGALRSGSAVPLADRADVDRGHAGEAGAGQELEHVGLDEPERIMRLRLDVDAEDVEPGTVVTGPGTAGLAEAVKQQRPGHVAHPPSSHSGRMGLRQRGDCPASTASTQDPSSERPGPARVDATYSRRSAGGVHGGGSGTSPQWRGGQKGVNDGSGGSVASTAGAARNPEYGSGPSTGSTNSR